MSTTDHTDTTDHTVTLVAVHGNGGGGFRFARAAPHVPAGVRFEAVTLPGFGGRPAEPGVVSMADHAEALWREIADLPRPLVLLGHGIGGSIALDLVQRHPVDGLIIHAPVGTRLERRWFPRVMRPRAVRRTIQWGISSRVTRPLVGRRFFSPDVPREYVDRFLGEYARAESFSLMFDVITPEWWDALVPAEVPSVLLWGDHDRVLGADQVDDYRRLLPRSVTDVVPGWGHFPMVEEPERYAAVIAGWAELLAGGAVADLPRLGVGRLVSALGDGVGSKAALLDRAAIEGLPVPAAVVVPDGSEAPTSVPLAGPVAVRSAFSAEDGDVRSNAGRFTTVLGVDPSDSELLVAAVTTVRESGEVAESAVGRRDVLVMEMVDAAVAGVAFSEPGWEDDLVEWVTGLADGLVGGRRRGESIALPRLRPGERPERCRPSWQQRLARLLRDVRAVFGDQGWDVEWADDGERCWLLQVRPVTVSPVRDEVFTIANHREILPDPPSVFMTSLIAAGSRELFEYYRRFDPSLPTDRPFIEVFDGRPLINLSLMTDLVRSVGLPTRLVTDSIGGADHVAAGPRPARSVRRAPVLVRMGLAQLGALGYARRRLDELDTLVATPATDLAEAVRRARTAHVTTVDGMTALNTAASGPTAVLRGLGVLEEHAARQRTATSRMLADLRSMEIEEWLERHGHRGIYESDLARPRYVDDPAPVLALRGAGRGATTAMTTATPPQRTWRGGVTWPLWLLARRPMAAREQFRADAMRSFLAIRRDLLRLAAEAGVAGDDLWLLDIDEVVALDRGELPAPELLERRRAEQDERRRRPIPELVRRFGPLDPEADGSSADPTSPVLRGTGLVARSVEGVAWVLDEPAHDLPDGFDPVTTVLVAPSVEPGWMSTFGLVAGVAVEIGGDLSHGSILLRELGLPSVTNVAGLHSRVSTGDRIRIDGGRGTVELLEPSITP